MIDLQLDFNRKSKAKNLMYSEKNKASKKELFGQEL
jgi:hypothetical protein